MAVTIKNGYYCFFQSDNEKLGKYFSTKEMACKHPASASVEHLISVELIEKLDKVREELGLPIVITSAFRSKEKQEALRKAGYETAKGVSQHELGNAVDLRTTTNEGMMKLSAILPKYFEAIGIAKSFYHVDTRKDKKRVWKYS